MIRSVARAVVCAVTAWWVIAISVGLGCSSEMRPDGTPSRKITSSDGTVTVTVPPGTVMPAGGITVTVVDTSAAPKVLKDHGRDLEAEAVLLVDLQPDGARFDPPLHIEALLPPPKDTASPKQWRAWGAFTAAKGASTASPLGDLDVRVLGDGRRKVSGTLSHFSHVQWFHRRMDIYSEVTPSKLRRRLGQAFPLEVTNEAVALRPPKRALSLILFADVTKKGCIAGDRANVGSPGGFVVPMPFSRKTLPITAFSCVARAEACSLTLFGYVYVRGRGATSARTFSLERRKTGKYSCDACRRDADCPARHTCITKTGYCFARPSRDAGTEAGGDGPPDAKADAGRYRWTYVGDGDCAYNDSTVKKPTLGSDVPKASFCDADQARTKHVSVCWDGVVYKNNNLKPGEKACTYKVKTKTSCSGGINKGRMYECSAL